MLIFFQKRSQEASEVQPRPSALGMSHLIWEELRSIRFLDQENYEYTALRFLNFEFWVCGGKDELRSKKRMIFREGSIPMIIFKRSFYPEDHLQ